MEAPIKDDTKQTGNLKGLVTSIVVLLVIIGILTYAFGLPANQQSKKISDTTQKQVPQVAGQSIEEDYVAPEDVTEPLAKTNDVTKNFYKVTAVVDGDTIKVTIDNKTETVRLIGVDTPETKDPRKPVQCFGVEASNFTKKSLTNQSVRLEQDTSQQNRDKYGRLLRYVYLPDNTMFNQVLVTDGYAYEYTYKVPYKFQSAFKSAEAEARSNNIGLWDSSTCNGKK